MLENDVTVAKAVRSSSMQKLFAAREHYNVKFRARMQPGMPLVAEDLVEAQR